MASINDFDDGVREELLHIITTYNVTLDEAVQIHEESLKLTADGTGFLEKLSEMLNEETTSDEDIDESDMAGVECSNTGVSITNIE